MTRCALVPRGVAALAILVSCVLQPGMASGETGEALFQKWCGACHTVGDGRLVGPDLAGVAERRSMDWIVKFTQHSQSLIKSGDPDAVALFEEYQRLPMPDQPLTEAQIAAIVEYTKRGPKGGTAAAMSQAASEARPSAGAIVKGQELFQGKARLVTGGAACNSCHDVQHDAVIGGGTLASDLTGAFSKLGGPGVRAILKTPPFPVMQRAYAGRALTDEEINALVAFLQDADSGRALQQPRSYGAGLAVGGGIGTAVLLGAYSLLWRRRRRFSVNRAIYDRQIRST